MSHSQSRLRLTTAPSTLREPQRGSIERRVTHRNAARIPLGRTGSAEDVAAAIEAQASFFLSPWFRFYITYDPRITLAKVKCPVLAIYGSRDVQIPAKENLDAVRQALELGSNRDYSVVVLPNLNHLFQTSRTGAIDEYAHIGETMSVVALNTVSDWILKHTVLPGSVALKQ